MSYDNLFVNFHSMYATLKNHNGWTMTEWCPGAARNEKYRGGAIMHSAESFYRALCEGFFRCSFLCQRGVDKSAPAVHGSSVSCKKRGIFFYLCLTSFNYFV